MADGSGGFCGLNVYSAVLGLEGGADVGEVEGLTVGCGSNVRLAPKGFGQAGPPFAEFAGGEDQDAVAGRCEVRDRGFHGTGAGAGEQQDVVLGAHKDFELGQHLLEEGAEFGSAVVHVGGGHGKLGGGQERGWAWGIQTSLMNHGLSLRISCEGSKIQAVILIVFEITEYTYL